MSRLSIRARVTAAAAGTVVLVLVLAGVVLFHALRVTLTDRVDRQLRTDVAAATRALGGGRLAAVVVRNRMVQLVDADGAVVVSSEPAGGPDAEPLVDPPPPWAPGSGPHFFGIENPFGDGTLRVVATPYGPNGDQWLVAARSDELVVAAGRSVVRAELVGVPLLTVALAIVVWFGVGRALKPVEGIRSTVSQITERHQSRRVPEPATGDEIARLAQTMNEMLDRLDAASVRERQLVADASHELRSPLASVRALLESRGAAPDPDAHDTEAMAAVLRLQGLVEQLLELAAQDAETPVPSQAVDLDDLVMEQAAILRRTTDLAVDTTGVTGGQAHGSEEGLRRVVDNLASNAARHAATTVRFEVEERDEQVIVVVADDGPGVSPADRAKVFDRFTRLDDARTRDRAGAGLGLAIVAGVVARHDGEVRLATDPALGGAMFTVSLPIGHPPSSDAPPRSASSNRSP